VLLLNMLNLVDFHIWTLNISTLLILGLYILSVRHLAAENGPQPEAVAVEESGDEDDVDGLSLRQIVVRFVLVSLGIICLSVVLTYITDDIAERLNLGSGLAGAIFLGVATSLPEVTSTISLFRMRNFDIAFGNIAGSNVFNYFVLAIADLLYVRGTVYFFEDSKVVNLTMFGMVASFVMFVMLCSRKMWVKVAMVLAAIGCYFAFLLV
jgi:cation:H+ antiporter